MKFEASSSKNALVMNGKAAHVVNPWSIEIDTNEETITIKKRNSYLIGVDEQTFSFRYIRNIKIDEHLFGADIHIKATGVTASAFCLSKSDAKKIRAILIDYNNTKKSESIIFS